MYNNICVSFPRLTKLSDARKKAIKARLQQYSLEDFKKLFDMAESSSFLKGQNDRNWLASFDWLLKDANMAKVLDGNYTSGNMLQYKSEKDKPKQLEKACEDNQDELIGDDEEWWKYGANAWNE